MTYTDLDDKDEFKHDHSGAGYIYAPYVPLYSTKTIGEYLHQPWYRRYRNGFMRLFGWRPKPDLRTRYAGRPLNHGFYANTNLNEAEIEQQVQDVVDRALEEQFAIYCDDGTGLKRQDEMAMPTAPVELPPLELKLMGFKGEAFFQRRVVDE